MANISLYWLTSIFDFGCWGHFFDILHTFLSLCLCHRHTRQAGYRNIDKRLAIPQDRWFRLSWWIFLGFSLLMGQPFPLAPVPFVLYLMMADDIIRGLSDAAGFTQPPRCRRQTFISSTTLFAAFGWWWLHWGARLVSFHASLSQYRAYYVAFHFAADFAHLRLGLVGECWLGFAATDFIAWLYASRIAVQPTPRSLIAALIFSPSAHDLSFSTRLCRASWSFILINGFQDGGFIDIDIGVVIALFR